MKQFKQKSDLIVANRFSDQLKGFEKNARPVENTDEEEEPVTKGKFFDKVLKGVKDLFEDE